MRPLAFRAVAIAAAVFPSALQAQAGGPATLDAARAVGIHGRPVPLSELQTAATTRAP